MRSALQARLLVALQHASGGIHTHDTGNAPTIDFLRPMLQVSKPKGRTTLS